MSFWVKLTKKPGHEMSSQSPTDWMMASSVINFMGSSSTCPQAIIATSPQIATGTQFNSKWTLRAPVKECNWMNHEIANI